MHTGAVPGVASRVHSCCDIHVRTTAFLMYLGKHNLPLIRTLMSWRILNFNDFVASVNRERAVISNCIPAPGGDLVG